MCFETRKGSAGCFEMKEYDKVGINMNMDQRSRNIRKIKKKMEIWNASGGKAEGLIEDNNAKSRIKVI